MGAEGGRASSRRGVPNRKRFTMMFCPYLHEIHRTSRRRHQDVLLTVPGMKKHVRQVHGESAYRRVKWPDLHANTKVRFHPSSGLGAMSLNELRQEAHRIGVNHHRMGKYELARVLLQYL